MARSRGGADGRGDGQGEDGWPYDHELGDYDFRLHIGRDGDEEFGFAEDDVAPDAFRPRRRLTIGHAGRSPSVGGAHRGTHGMRRLSLAVLGVATSALAVFVLWATASGPGPTRLPRAAPASRSAVLLSRPETLGARLHRAGGTAPARGRRSVRPVCDVAMPCHSGYPIGLTVTSAAAEPRHDLGDVLGRRLGLPGGTVVVATPAQGAATLRLWRTTVDASGTVVAAAPRTSSMAAVAGRLSAALAFATVSWFCFDILSGRRLGEGPVGMTRRIASGASFAWVLATSPHAGTVGTVFEVVAALSLLSSPVTRLRIVGIAFAVLCARAALGVPVLPPFPTLADLYGPLGVWAWDFVGLGGMALAGLAVAATRWGGRTSEPLLGSPPSVQDVRGPG